ncbi:MAG: tetratricopeptide repeat protein [Proteobacteria bacterium]|nr:tetratricopeptide repeat protein [Pseudomonadota bacterium]
MSLGLSTEWSVLVLVALVGLLLGLLIARAVGYRQAVRKGSDLSRNYFRGLNYLLNEEPDKAIEVFIQALEVDEDTVELHLALGKLFRRSGELDRATRLHQNLIARPALSTGQRQTAIYELAHDYMSAGLYDRAEGLFEELTGHPEYRDQALSALVRVYELEKDWSAAIDASRSMGENEPRNRIRMLHYYCELAELGFVHEDMDSVTASLGKAQKLDPNSPRATMLKVQMLLSMGDWGQALDEWEHLVSNQAQYAAIIDDVFLQLDSMSEKQQRRVLVLIKKLVLELEDLPMAEKAIELCSSLDGQAAANRLLHEWSNHCTGPARVYALKKLVVLDGKSSAEYTALASFVLSADVALIDYLCSECGFEAKTMLWQCPNCNEWGSLMRQLSGDATAIEKPFANGEPSAGEKPLASEQSSAR